MDTKMQKSFRLLSIYTRLCEGKAIHKGTEAMRFMVSAKTIQRDLDDIRAYFAELQNREGESKTVVYDAGTDTYILKK